MKLYEIDAELERIATTMFDEETGELNDDAYELFEQLQLDRKEKIENAACLYKNLMSDAEQLIIESKKLKERAEKLIRRADGVHGWLSHVLDGEAVTDSAKCEIKWRKSQSVDITDETKIPDQYLDIKVVIKPMKMAIKKALKGGESVPGAALIDTNNMRID